MGSGVQKMQTGSFLGTGSTLEIRTVTFRPRKVELFNQDGLAFAMWQKGMADASMMKQVTAGTMTLVSSNGITPLSDGFSLGADADVNASGEQVFWTAYE